MGLMINVVAEKRWMTDPLGSRRRNSENFTTGIKTTTISTSGEACATAGCACQRARCWLDVIIAAESFVDEIAIARC